MCFHSFSVLLKEREREGRETRRGNGGDIVKSAAPMNPNISNAVALASSLFFAFLDFPSSISTRCRLLRVFALLHSFTNSAHYWLIEGKSHRVLGRLPSLAWTPNSFDWHNGTMARCTDQFYLVPIWDILLAACSHSGALPPDKPMNTVRQWLLKLPSTSHTCLVFVCP